MASHIELRQVDVTFLAWGEGWCNLQQPSFKQSRRVLLLLQHSLHKLEHHAKLLRGRRVAQTCQSVCVCGAMIMG